MFRRSVRLIRTTRTLRKDEEVIDKALSIIENTFKHPRELLIVPVQSRPLFPGFFKALSIKDRSLVEGVKGQLERNNPYVSVFMKRQENDDSLVAVDGIYPVGVVAQVYNMLAEPDGGMTLLLLPLKRVALEKWISKEVLPKVVVRDLVDEIDGNLDQLSGEVVKTLNQMASLNPLVKDQIQEFVKSKDSAGKLADFAAAMSDVAPQQLQAILQATNIRERLELALEVLQKELRNAELQHKISADLERLISERDRETFLNSRLRNIQKELGVESQSRDKVIEKFNKRLKELVMPAEVKKVYDDELSKLLTLKPSAQEYNLTNTYLDWLTQYPWGKHSKESFNLSSAQKVLDEDHYGLKDVKNRILEFVAVAKLRNTVEGKIICLMGPPGVGKTSIGKSIARSLQREFYRFSVGGLYDVAEIKGHRRTYVGALPGKIVQALKRTQTENPLILIDEVDKIGHGGSQGDPSSALLEVLDPEQNGSFMDHYLDVSSDLSKVLFVCTANTTDTIPEALLDRMEIIRLSGYISEEKVEIARNYLIPQALKAAGLQEDTCQLQDDALKSLIHWYCRENGVRNLKKHIEKIFRKCALQRVEGQDIITVTTDNLRSYIGGPQFTSDRMYEKTPAGVVMGLAYNSYGGSSLYIETITSDKKEASLKITGNMGDVMKESASIAFSYAQYYLNQNFGKTVNQQIHLHVPEGATPKDGPSAGVAMTTSIISCVMDKPLKLNVAMTGEISLSGKVLKIGGVKEKTIAAKRSGVEHIILPAANEGDWKALPDHIREGLQVHFVDIYPEVSKILFD